MKHLYLYLLFIPSILFVYLYNKLPQNNQVLNKKLLWNICGWNLAHSLCFFIICLFVFPTTLYDYIEIFIFMLVWFVFELFFYHMNSKMNIFTINYHSICNHNKGKENNKCKNQIYNNPYIPRFDDIIFNFIGIGLFTIYYHTRYKVMLF